MAMHSLIRQAAPTCHSLTPNSTDTTSQPMRAASSHAPTSLTATQLSFRYPTALALCPPPPQSPNPTSQSPSVASTLPTSLPASSQITRRSLLGVPLALGVTMTLAPPSALAVPTVPLAPYNLDELENAAFAAYANRDFVATVDFLDEIISREPERARWWEMRAQVWVDFKDFDSALIDFNKAMDLTPESEYIVQARLRSGRALAYEGLSKWRDALQDYEEALILADRGGESLDPYVINSRGNCYNSLGMWAEAREDYLASSQLFQQARGFRGRNGNTTARLDGAIFAASNAALMLVQMGDSAGAIKEMEAIARRAPGSADMRAALAAMYYNRSEAGDRERAEGMWNFACENIVVSRKPSQVGCAKFQDPDFLIRVRRWPPVMVDRMQAFLNLDSPPGL